MLRSLAQRDGNHQIVIDQRQRISSRSRYWGAGGTPKSKV